MLLGDIEMKPEINEKECIGCGACVAMCPQGVLEMSDDGKAKVVHPEKCDNKWACIESCPVEAIKKVK